MASSQPPKKLRLSAIALSSGQSAPSSSSSSAAQVDIPLKHQALHGKEVLSWTEGSGRILKFLRLPGSASSPATVEIPNEVVETAVLALGDKVAVHFKTHADSWAEVYRVDSVGTATKVCTLGPRPGGQSALSLSTSGGQTYLVWTLPTGETVLYNTEDAEALASYPLAQPLDFGITHAISEVVPRAGGSSFAVRTFLSSSAPGFAGDSYLVRNGEVAWSRRESLSSVVASTWVELLDPSTEDIVGELDVETHKTIGAAYVHRVNRHLNELAVHGPGWLRALPHRIYSAFLTKDADADMPTGKWRDFFGFRKFAIVVTADGGLAAIDVGRNGEVAWKTALVGSQEEQQQQFQGVSGIYEVRKGTVGIVLTSGEYREYNAFEGTLLLREPLGDAVRAAAQLDGAAHRKAVVAVLENGKVAALPPGNPGGSDVGDSGGGRNFGPEPVHLALKTSPRLVRGIRISSSLKPEETWAFAPPTAGEVVTSVVGRPAHDPVASVGRVLGDRSVMYKYLNRHLSVITTVNPALSAASVYLVDAVSGSVLHSATHARVDTSQPPVATVSENWVVYTYFGDDGSASAPNDAAKGYHLVVSDLYESEFANDRGALGPATNVSAFTTAGSGKPYVLSQSYIFPSAISALAVSSTKQGITSREILAVLPGSSGIYTIAKRILEPRRPVGRDTDNAEKEEGLFPYTPTVEIDPKLVITHQRPVMGLKMVSTSPSQLESTSLVFAYGGDLFGTRLAPSMAFDILGKGFGKVQLVLTVVGLTIGTLFVAPMVRKKQIDSRWVAAA